ncbi:type IV secretory system conjugative DNA transfer family protein [Methylocystis hirsuta]|uniref:ATP-binding protein n=1 Tax=Methylocystis hirsuta TaxID=369798 RepID=A0A3M9XUS4_9HYPH|nr:type IV secretion system DNA-binding domain-containing protein [Methylocystis hirsuta]RNJ51396.1 ATP-binding protein [Methylocystis hirsuta]
MHTDNSYILGTLTNGERVPLLQPDRRRHVYIAGQTGTGKTEQLTNLMRADLVSGAGFCFLDPHGDASRRIAGMTPRERTRGVIYLDPSDPTHTFSYNPLSGIPADKRATATANIVSAFKNIWAQSWGPRLEYILTNSLRLLLDTKDQSLLGLPRLLVDDTYREWLVKRCNDPVIRAYWRNEYAAYDDRHRTEAISPVQNKIGILLSNPFIRSIVSQPASTIDARRIMDTGRVLIVNLSKGRLGEEPAHLLGALLITAFAQAAEARQDLPEDERRDFTLYCDEFQNFATDSFASILSEARKWRLSLVAANQHVSQLPETLRHAVFGNAGTIIAFRVGAHDASALADELGLKNRTMLAQTDNFKAWARVMHDGAPTEARLIHMSPPPEGGNRLASIVANSRTRYMVPRAIVEKQIEDFFPRRAPTRPRRRKKHRNPDA